MDKTLYLTIDDGPSADFLNKLDFLDARGIPAVWFCQGNNMEQRPQMVIEAIQRGHIIGNHSYSHPSFSDLPLAGCYAEIRAGDAVVEELYARAGRPRPGRFFRFPYGDKGNGLYGNTERRPDAAGQERQAAIQDYLRQLGYTQPPFADITYRYYRAAGMLDHADWYWTYDTFDWGLGLENVPYGINSLEKMFARMEEDEPEGCRGLNYPHSADIVLIHDHERTAAAFTALVTRLVEKGYRFALPF